jgi:aminopeptidase N
MEFTGKVCWEFTADASFRELFFHMKDLTIDEIKLDGKHVDHGLGLSEVEQDTFSLAVECEKSVIHKLDFAFTGIINKSFMKGVFKTRDTKKKVEDDDLECV